MKRKLICLLLALVCLCAPVQGASAKEIPMALKFKAGEEQTTQLDDLRSIATFAPVTSREDVNAELAALTGQMTAKALPVLLAAEPAEDCDSLTLKIGTAVSRAGAKWMSFLTTANIDGAERYIDCDTRVYDMETGRRLALSDVLLSSPEALGAVSAAIGEGIRAYYPDIQPDEAALRSALENTDAIPFTLSPGALRFHMRADSFYPGKDTLLNVKLYYADIRPYMTEQAAAQTDCSDYKLMALTFDDGPAGASTEAVADLLKRHGADGTFFIVGSRLKKNSFALKYVHDGGFTLGSHSQKHHTRYLAPSEIRAEMEAFDAALLEELGIGVKLMRAPGGYERPYLDAKIDLPLINWSVASGDGTSTRSYKKRDIYDICNQVMRNSKDGAVVLFHDLRRECPKYLTPLLEYFEENNLLCVTVDELYSIRGEALEAGNVYHGLCEPRE